MAAKRRQGEHDKQLRENKISGEQAYEASHKGPHAALSPDGGLLRGWRFWSLRQWFHLRQLSFAAVPHIRINQRSSHVLRASGVGISGLFKEVFHGWIDLWRVGKGIYVVTPE